MKIIGETNEGFIVDISKDELANLIGFSSAYVAKDKVTLGIGKVLNVGTCYKAAQEALSLESEARDAANRLKSAALKFLAFHEKPEK